jgi:hypothetical protein
MQGNAHADYSSGYAEIAKERVKKEKVKHPASFAVAVALSA